MSLAYTAPTWEDGTGTGISASQLQAISNCIEGLVQGTDKAVHYVTINGSSITLTFADGTQETFSAVDLKGIVSIEKTGESGDVDTYTITYTDGTTSTFTVTNGSAPNITAQATADALSSDNPTVVVTKTGTDHAPTFTFAFSGLKGAQGQTGQTGPAGADGVSPTITITTITGGHTVTITDADHPSGQSFNVMDGTGTGDMEASTYDPLGAVATAGGIPAFVAEKDDEWTTAATVSSGSVTFTGLDDTLGYAYEPYFEVDGNSTELNPTAELTTISGAGSVNMTLIYTTNADAGSSCKLRIIK